MIALGMLVAAFSLGWTCYSATASATTVTSGSAAASEEAANASVADDMSQPLNGGRGATTNKLSREIEHKADVDEDDGGAVQPGDAGGVQPDSRLWYFHVVMAAGALYMAMLLTNWGTGSVQDEPSTSPSASGSSGGKVIVHSSSTGLAQMWVKIISQWLAIAIYVW